MSARGTKRNGLSVYSILSLKKNAHGIGQHKAMLWLIMRCGYNDWERRIAHQPTCMPSLRTTRPDPLDMRRRVGKRRFNGANSAEREFRLLRRNWMASFLFRVERIVGDLWVICGWFVYYKLLAGLPFFFGRWKEYMFLIVNLMYLSITITHLKFTNIINQQISGGPILS